MFSIKLRLFGSPSYTPIAQVDMADICTNIITLTLN